jgi:hypothetical protein
LLAFGGNVVDGCGDEVVGFEDLEVASGGVVALGAVDDGLGGGNMKYGSGRNRCID